MKNIYLDPLTSANFFCGMGVDSTANQLLGLHPTIIADINPFATATYQLNTDQRIPYTVADAKNYSTEQFHKAVTTYTGNLFNHYSLSQNDVDLLSINLKSIFLAKSTHSCKDLTKANPNRDTTSERSEAIYHFLNFVEDCKPSYVLIENVPDFTYAKDSKGRLYLDETVKRLKQANYNLMIDNRTHVLRHKSPKKVRWILNAADYGDPQIRKRFTLFASKDPLPAPHVPQVRPRVDYGTILDQVNSNGDSGDSRAYDDTVIRIKDKEFNTWFKGSPKGLNTWSVCDPSGIGQTRCVMWLDKWYMWVKSKYFKPEFVKNGKVIKTHDEKGNQAWRRMSIPESLAMFNANVNTKWPTKPMYNMIDKKVQAIDKKMKQLLIGQGFPNGTYYHLVKQIIPKSILKKFEINLKRQNGLFNFM